MYADDTAIYIDATDQKDVVKCLSDELVRVSKWCQNNRLVIQVKQSFAMFLSIEENKALIQWCIWMGQLLRLNPMLTT